MTETSSKHPVDYFAPILGRYEALEAMIESTSDPEHIRSLLEALNETFRLQCDLINTREFPSPITNNE